MSALHGAAAGLALLALWLVVRDRRWPAPAPRCLPVRETREPVAGGATMLVREWHDAGDAPRTDPRPVPERRVPEDDRLFTGDWR